MNSTLIIVFTGIIALATAVYACSAWKLYMVSKEFTKNRFKEKMVEIKIDKAVEFFEITAPILMGLRSVARTFLDERGGNMLPIPHISEKQFSAKDKYGIDRVFWQIHIMYEPATPRHIWKKYEEFGVAYEKFRENANLEYAQKILRIYDEFQSLIKEIYNLEGPEKAFNLLVDRIG